MKNWFNGVRTLDELKAAYRKLAIIHHPDKGGRTEDMQEINAQYEQNIGLIRRPSRRGVD